MNSIETLTTFFGWCTVISVGIGLFFVLAFGLFHGVFTTLSAKMFGITTEEAGVTFFRVFQQYRLALVLLNFVPYLALKMMS